MNMDNTLKILENSISDVGYWSWWVDSFPGGFQLEFSGTQLWNPPSSDDQPPSGQIALRFTNPKSVNFISRANADDNIPYDWVDKLFNNAIDPFGISCDDFALQDSEKIQRIINEAIQIIPIYGELPKKINFDQTKAKLAFWAGKVGAIVAAEEMMLLNQEGIIPLSHIKDKSEKWWTYWREYWNAKNNGTPYPKDYACEVTIPIKS